MPMAGRSQHFEPQSPASRAEFQEHTSAQTRGVVLSWVVIAHGPLSTLGRGSGVNHACYTDRGLDGSRDALESSVCGTFGFARGDHDEVDIFGEASDQPVGLREARSTFEYDRR